MVMIRLKTSLVTTVRGLQGAWDKRFIKAKRKEEKYKEKKIGMLL